MAASRPPVGTAEVPPLASAFLQKPSKIKYSKSRKNTPVCRLQAHSDEKYGCRLPLRFPGAKLITRKRRSEPSAAACFDDWSIDQVLLVKKIGSLIPHTNLYCHYSFRTFVNNKVYFRISSIYIYFTQVHQSYCNWFPEKLKLSSSSIYFRWLVMPRNKMSF